jgi:hypothetical protein
MTMALVKVPEGGDVVISTRGPDVHPAYALRSVAGPDQLGCATRAEVEKMARGFAEHARVNVWLAGAPNEFTLLVCFRESERGTPARSAVAARLQPPAQSPKPARAEP